MTSTEIRKLSDLSDDEILAWARDLLDTEFESTLTGNESPLTGLFGNYPPHIGIRVIGYGFQQLYNDGTGSLTGANPVTAEEKRKNADIKFKRHLNGIWTERGRGGVSRVLRRAEAIARRTILAALAEHAKVAPTDAGNITPVMIRDSNNATAVAVLRDFVEFSGKAGNTADWKEAALAKYIKDHDLIVAARKELAAEAAAVKEGAEKISADELRALMGVKGN